MFWNLLAKFLAIPSVTDWLICRALQTPYTHIRSAEGCDVYMYRFWLFNPYLATDEKVRLTEAGHKIPWSFPISVRLHRIMRADSDRDLHDHPWDARTIILRGGYTEDRLKDSESLLGNDRQEFCRPAGTTATLKFGEYHQITRLTPGGVWTLFITYKYQGTWGFLVDGVKVPYYKYIKRNPS